uniref:Thyrotropin subunit beta n=1 Tax=Anguilla japonica TaxID=7937 RepID=TSHB_ANGJA|nr:RecName: Full=Thyrotropin subunit beta; AltName: Full=Thyroid-stimulating hormone subunit beta; Short=TSH-B; Short=TSH-beta; AltName: Full=Thyrotropin beta chain; Flags: Precursor [Anguilla japonica]AAO17791.1 thyroid stimulating hormone beta subunit precursor [Anguilla japonica]BAD14300.1 thyroid-stimulating hormone beta subunit [Anguilla japonica]
MRVVLLASGVLCLLAGQVLSICSPVDYTLYVEKPECDFCVAINTTICMGFCYSLDPNVVGPAVKRLAVQRGCTYQAVEYRTAELPGCPPHVDPRFSYPVALHCTCRACDPARDECTHRASADGDRCSKPLLLHMHAYPGQSNHIQTL